MEIHVIIDIMEFPPYFPIPYEKNTIFNTKPPLEFPNSEIFNSPLEREGRKTISGNAQ